MMNHIRHFMKARVRRGSGIWSLLLIARAAIEALQRLRCRILLPAVRLGPLGDLSRFEAKWYSQHGEDGILQAILRRLGPGPKYAVEFGVEDGAERNTRLLMEKQGWTGLLMDPAPNPPLHIKQAFVTAENINRGM